MEEMNVDSEGTTSTKMSEGHSLIGQQLPEFFETDNIHDRSVQRQLSCRPCSSRVQVS